jgi:YesN/AraC family two-component response regulator
LGTNKRYISDCINTQKGITFIQLVNKYRIEYAKRLLKDNPDIKITEVYIKSGFANETSFFRVFKAHTGLTPSQYKI